MKILTATGGMAVTNAWLLVDEDTKEAVLFDAPDHTVEPLLDAVASNDWTLKGLWLTHGHFDHLADHAEVLERFPQAEILIHALDAPKLHTPGSKVFPLPFVIPPGRETRTIADGEVLKLGSQDVRVIFTPGHSPGHVSFHLPAHELLIGGDLIIGGAVGRTDLPGSDERQLYKSVQRIMQLPPGTKLLPGHGAVTTLADEAKTNRYVQMILSQA